MKRQREYISAVKKYIIKYYIIKNQSEVENFGFKTKSIVFRPSERIFRRNLLRIDSDLEDLSDELIVVNRFEIIYAITALTERCPKTTSDQIFAFTIFYPRSYQKSKISELQNFH